MFLNLGLSILKTFKNYLETTTISSAAITKSHGISVFSCNSEKCTAMLYFQILGCGVGQTLQWKRAFEQFWRPLVNKWSNHVPQKWNFTHKIEQLVQFVLTVIKICHLPPPFMPNLECTNCIVLTAFCKNLSTPTTVLTIMVSKYPRLNTPRVALQLLQTGSLYS